MEPFLLVLQKLRKLELKQGRSFWIACYLGRTRRLLQQLVLSKQWMYESGKLGCSYLWHHLLCIIIMDVFTFCVFRRESRKHELVERSLMMNHSKWQNYLFNIKFSFDLVNFFRVKLSNHKSPHCPNCSREVPLHSSCFNVHKKRLFLPFKNPFMRIWGIFT